MSVNRVVKRNGTVAPFDRVRIENGIYAAARAAGNGESRQWAEAISWAVVGILEQRFGQNGHRPHVEEIQDVVEEILVKSGSPQVARTYTLYRQKQAEARATQQMLLNVEVLVDDYLQRADWRVNENSNMNYSLQGLNFYVASSIAARYWLHKIYPPEAQRAHVEGDLHLHDLGMLSTYTYFGKEVVIAKSERGIELISFAKLYELCEQSQVTLNAEEDVYAKFPSGLQVLDKDGWTGVSRLVRKKRHRPMRFVKNRGGRSVIVTDNHPMLTRGGEKEAGKVEENSDYLMTVDLRRLLKDEGLFSRQYVDLAHELSKRELPSTQGRGQLRLNSLVIDSVVPEIKSDNGDMVSIGSHAMPRYVGLTEELGKCVGWILADGFVSQDVKTHSSIMLVQKDVTHLVKIADILRGIGVPSCIDRRDDRYELFIPNRVFRLLLTEVFQIGYGARNKILPVQILQFNKQFVKGLLAGLIDGDGNAHETQIQLRLTSRTMLEQCATVLYLLGVWPRDRAIDGLGTERIGPKGQVIRQRYPIYGVAFRKTGALELDSFKYKEARASNRKWMDETDDEWHTVLNNKPTDIPDEFIYDITTDTHTLVVNGMWNHNCCGWDLQDLLIQGFGGVPAKIESKPPKHLRTALGQLVNFFYTLQGESAGAVAVSNFDTLLAPFVRYDGLDFRQTKQAIQEYVFNINVPTRVGFQTPFTNQTMDLTPPSTLRDQPVIIGGEPRSATYGEFQREMDVLNRAFAEVMLEGDAKGRVFTFPIPTYNVTRDFDWDNPELEPVWAMTARYGIPYWANFVNSDMDPEDARSMCCRLRLDNRELRKRIGGLFAAAPLTGSVGVVTVNMSRLGYLARDEATFLERLEQLMEVARASLEIKREILERLTAQGLYPYSHHYLQGIKKRFGNYWSNHFSTIGLIGMNEACLNLLGVGIAYPEGQAFAVRTLEFMREVLARFQAETDNLYNLEATPAEGASFRLARADRERFPDIITAGTSEAPFYTNSTHLPVNYTDDLFEALEHQDELQTLYTGGTVQHVFLGEQLDDWRQARRLVRTIAENFHLPYYTLTPTFSICPVHGYISGEHQYCPHEHTEEELMRFGRLVKG